jgi:hypothetical protein
MIDLFRCIKVSITNWQQPDEDFFSYPEKQGAIGGENGTTRKRGI